MAKISIDPARKNQIDSQKALVVLDEWFNEQIERGYAVPGRNFTLSLKPDDRAYLASTFVLAKEADNFGAPIPPLIDMAGVAHNVTLDYFTLIMLGYNQYYATLSNNYASQKQNILDS